MCKDKLIIVATYGSLRKGGELCKDEHILCSSEDAVNGTLFDVKTGLSFDFPGIHLGGEKEVKVEVQVVTQEYFDYMVLVEGGLYKVSQVITRNGVPCLIFECLLSYRDEDVIKSGDWVEYNKTVKVEEI